MNPWDSLPNGKRINEVLEFARNKLDSGNLLATSNARTATQARAWIAAWSAARGATQARAWSAAWSAARGAAWSAARDAARSAARDAAWDLVWNAVPALVAYDYAGELYDAELDVVELAAHAEDPAAVLMLPMLKVMKHTKEKP